MVWSLVALSWGLTGCDPVSCVYQSDCVDGELCVESTCREACTINENCNDTTICTRGACVPGIRPDAALDATLDATLDAALDDAADGSADADAETDTGLDLGPDGGDASLDASLDMGPDVSVDMSVDATFDATFDAGDASGDAFNDAGAAGFDLSGLYSVTRTVTLSSDGEPPVGSQSTELVRLESLGAGVHRLTVFEVTGEVRYEIAAVEILQVEPETYQYTFSRALPDVDGCQHQEQRFQRGVVRFAGRLEGREDIDKRYEGAGCPVSTSAQVRVVWVPLPS